MQGYASAFFNSRGKMTNSIEEVQKWRYQGITSWVVVNQEDDKVYIRQSSIVSDDWYENPSHIMFEEPFGAIIWKPCYKAKEVVFLDGGKKQLMKPENVMRQIASTIGNLYCLWYSKPNEVRQEVRIKLIAIDADEYMALAQNSKKEFLLLKIK